MADTASLLLSFKNKKYTSIQALLFCTGDVICSQTLSSRDVAVEPQYGLPVQVVGSSTIHCKTSSGTLLQYHVDPEAGVSW